MSRPGREISLALEAKQLAFRKSAGRRRRVAGWVERLILYAGWQCAARLQVQNLYIQAKATGDPQIKREMRRRSAVEPVIGHLKEEHRMGRNYLAHRKGDLDNAVLAAVGYNFRRLIRWLRILLRLYLAMLFPPPNSLPA